MHQYLTFDKRYRVFGFCVNAQFITENQKLGLPVFDIENLRVDLSEHKFSVVMGIGYKNNNTIRQMVFEQLLEQGVEILTYVHPDAKVYSTEKLGVGSVIMANTVVEPFAEVGANSVIWSNVVVGHHSNVGDNCWIASGAALGGSSELGDNSFVGINATIANEVKIERNNIIGGNCLISRNTKEDCVFIAGQAQEHRFKSKDYSTYFMR